MRPAGILLCLALLAGCSTRAPAVTAAGPVATTTMSPGQTPAASCSDPPRSTPGVQLAGATLVEDDSGLDVTFRLDAAPPRPESLELAVSIWTSRGAPVRELAVHWSAGDPDAYVYDMRSGSATQIPAQPTITATTEAIAFPLSTLRGLGRSWEWDAWATEGMQPVDDCPRSQDGTPPRVTFPG